MIAPQLSLEDQDLLKRAFGAAFLANATVTLPLRPRLKVHTLMELIGLPGSFAFFAWMPGIVSAKGFFTLTSFAITMFALHFTVFAMLVLRRRLVFQQSSPTAHLHQRGKSFPLGLVLPANGNLWLRRSTILHLNGGEFPLKRKAFANRSTVHAAMTVLEGWIRAQSHGSAMFGSGAITTQGTGAFLAFLDVVQSGAQEVVFRSRYNSARVQRLWGASIMFMMLGSCLATLPAEFGLKSAAITDVFAVFVILFSAIWAVYLRTVQREITVRTGECIQVKWRNRIAAYPLWTCWFYAQPGDTQDPSSGPYRPHILLNFGDEVAILAVTGRYTREELDVFAARMNHFLWGSPNPPHDPDAPDDIPPYNLAAARNFIWVPPVVRPRTGAGR